MTSSAPIRAPRLHFDLTTIQLFIAVADQGSITRGAERVHLAAAAASRRILELESQLGVSVFERLPHGMALTEAGRALLAHARGITYTVQRMQDDAASFVGGDLGVVRVAAPKSAVIQFLPFDIQRCNTTCPGVRIDLQEMNSQEVQQSLRRGTVDIGIYEGSLGVIDLPTEPYRDDRLVLVVARGHALARRKQVTTEDVLDCDLIVLGESSAISIGLERLAEEAGRVLHMRMRVGGFDSIAALVAQNLGAGVMPEAIAGEVAAGSRFVRLPIAEPWAKRQFVLCHRPHGALSSAALSVLEVLAQNAKPESQK
ncbi:MULTISPECIES: LysR family transcriptional regulator [unclassified Cupriavidus]|uniref:LysR family transcriptional regulator n=1 Tax=unclassified Cupriavidus TaxID=2640874 RepID=UPI0004279337|nr:LysR family transcriptional regulator [Cupriavidus sp. amp6]MBP0630179.1 LysR family transcriptional regulator [Cupriavidus sp. AcVe19-1a]MBP0637810.1 LysR family transcriptional regulator [Cupriavidus sp. AcVe19-6a]